MELNLSAKTVLITGGSKGIGAAVAESFAAEGANVHLVARDAATLQSTADKIRQSHQVDARFSALDLSQSAAVAQLQADCPEPDILVNNAGAIRGGDLQAINEEIWREGWDLKVFGYINMARAYLKRMEERGHGVIVNVIGLAGVRMDANYICGSTGNAALDAFTRAAGSYSLEKGVRVLGIHPGAVATDRLVGLLKTRAKNDTGNEDDWQQYNQSLPMGRPIHPEEVADVVTFLASARASYLSGIVIPIDGGFASRGGSH